MQHCDQAIILVQKNKKGVISPNLMFEWGFLLGELNSRKVNKYFIDIERTDPCIPSDVQGMWTNDVFSTELKSVDEIVTDITNDFFNRQKIRIEGDKITTVLDWYKTRRIINNYTTRPEVTDYELAQYIFLYVYSGKFFENILNDVSNDLEKLSRALDGRQRSLQSELGVILYTSRQSIRFLRAINTYELPNGAQEAYVSSYDYEEFSDIFSQSMRDIKRFDEGKDGEPKLVFTILLRNFIVYLNVLMLVNPNISDDDRSKYAALVAKHSYQLIKECEELDKLNDRDNDQLIWLMLSYTYRTLYCSVVELEKHGLIDLSTENLRDKHESEKEQFLRESLANRRKLYRYYRGENINGEFFDTIEMEYNLALAEYLRYESDEDEHDAACDKLRHYINKTQKLSRIKSICIDIITSHLPR